MLARCTNCGTGFYGRREIRTREGVAELTPPFSKKRVRNPGGGRKKLQETNTALAADLEELLEPKGDPLSMMQWTTKSLAHLVAALEKKRHAIKKSALASL